VKIANINTLSELLEMPSLPEAICFDAVGTLFGVKGSVGEAYSEFCQRFDLQLNSEDLDRAFYNSFKAAFPPAFPGANPTEIGEKEFDWWYDIAIQTFSETGDIGKFADFRGFFQGLFEYFATADPWVLYADTQPALAALRDRGIILAVISNFDSRLYRVLQAFHLSEFFSSVIISTEVGAAKPDAQIFTSALQNLQLPPEAVWHVGDSRKADGEGARSSGLYPILISRS